MAVWKMRKRATPQANAYVCRCRPESDGCEVESTRMHCRVGKYLEFSPRYFRTHWSPSWLRRETPRLGPCAHAVAPVAARGSGRWTADAREDIYPGARGLRPGERPDPAPRNRLPVLCRLFPYLVDRARLLTTTFATAAAAATFAADIPPPSPLRAVLCISFLSFPLFASLCSHSTIRRATSNPPLLQQCRRRAPAPATHVRPAETAPPARLARREGCTATTRPTRCVVCGDRAGTDRACAPGQCQCRRGAPAPTGRPRPRPGTPMCAPGVPRVRTPRPKKS